MKSTHNYSKPVALAALFAGMVGTASAAVVSTVGTTGTYDATSNANTIDNDPGIALATFKTTVATAFANDLGGVIDWTTGAGTLANSGTSPGNTLTTPSFTASYGTGGSSTLTITTDVEMGLYTNSVNNQTTALTDGTAVTPNIGNAPEALSFTFTFSGADVVEIGAGMLSRSTYGNLGVDFRATATYSDTSTDTIDYLLGNTKGGSDTFLHFAATGGKTISSFNVAVLDDNAQGINLGGLRPVMDDFGFVVAVPEPSSSALLGLAGLALIFRRRR